MTYATEILKKDIRSRMLCVLSPTHVLYAGDVTWTNHGSYTMSSTPWTLGRVVSVVFKTSSPTYKVDGVETASEAACDTQAYGYYYDATAKKLWVNYTAATMATAVMSVTYEICVSTHAVKWYADPLDTSSDLTYYDPTLIGLPSSVQSLGSDSYFGFLPSTSTTISIVNSDGLYTPHLQSIFNGARVTLYHCVGDMAVANIVKFFVGSCSKISTNDTSIILSLIDDLIVFDKTIDVAWQGRQIFARTTGSPANTATRTYVEVADATDFIMGEGIYAIGAATKYVYITGINSSSAPYYVDHDTVTPQLTAGSQIYLLRSQIGYKVYGSTYDLYGTTVDPKFVGRPLRKIYGRVDGVIGVNINYSLSASVGAGNIFYLFHNTKTDLEAIVDADTPGGMPANTNTRTYIAQADAQKLSVGDWVIATDTGVGAAPAQITVVNATSGPNYYIDHTAVAAYITAGNQDNIYRDSIGWVKYFDKPTSSWVDLTPSLEYASTNGVVYLYNGAGTRFATYVFGTDERFMARVYGDKTSVTLSDVAFGSNSIKTGNLTAADAILVELLQKAGVPDVDIAISSGDASTELSFSIPPTVTQENPTYRDVIARLLTSIMGKLYLNENRKWELSLTEPMGTADHAINSSHIIGADVDFEHDYTDIISRITVGYDFAEITTSAQSVFTLSTATAHLFHDIYTIKTKAFNTFLLYAADAATLATRLSIALGARQGTYKFSVKNDFYLATIGDVVSLTRERLPGYVLAYGTNRSIDMVITSITKSLRGIEITCNDQYNIEKHASEW